MKRTLFGFLVLIAFSHPVAGEEVSFKAGVDYQISLPGDWVEIPKEALEQYQKAVSDATGQKMTYEYGYQSTQTDNWFEYPYALVQVKRTGRIPEGQLKNYKKIESEMSEGLKKVEESAGSLLSNTAQGETIYDPTIHTLWSSVSVDVEGVGKVKGLTAVKLTEYGYIQFMGYALEKEFAQFEPLYRKIVHSIKVEEKDIYKPRITDNAPTVFGINLGRTAIAAIVGALIAGLFGLFKKFSRNNS